LAVGLRSLDPGLEGLRSHNLKLECFANKLGTYKGEPVHLELKPNAVPVFLKARQFPFPRQQAVCNKLKILETLGAISKINHSLWATPLVVVPQKGAPEESGKDILSEDVRLCGDYRSTLNSVVFVEPSTQDTPEQ